jgi:hypothetical protein
VPEPALAWSEGWLWLSGSLLLAVLWANLAWFFRQPRSGKVGEFSARLISWRFSPWLLQFLRLLYYVGVPFAALLLGHDVVVGRLLGLQRFDLSALGEGEAYAATAANWLDWAYDVGWTAGLCVGAWVLLALGCWACHQALVVAGETGVVARVNVSSWVLLREAVYHEVHWTFYRNMPILAWGTYWGIWGGLALVALEAMLNPSWRKGLTDSQRAPAHLLRAALAVVSSVLFLLTQNLWLALALHWAVSWGLVAFVRALPLLPTRKPDQASA